MLDETVTSYLKFLCDTGRYIPKIKLKHTSFFTDRKRNPTDNGEELLLSKRIPKLKYKSSLLSPAAYSSVQSSSTVPKASSTCPQAAALCPSESKPHF